MNEPVEQNLGSSDTDAALPYRTRLTSEAKRENMRGFLAAALFFLLAGTITASFFVEAFRPARHTELIEWLHIVLSPLVALVGAATGFYFGAHSAQKD